MKCFGKFFHKYEVDGFCYELYSPYVMDYGIRTYRMIKCEKCGHQVQESLSKIEKLTKKEFEEELGRIQSMGYMSFADYYKVRCK